MSIKSFHDRAKFMEDIEYHELDLSTAFKRQAALYAWYSKCYADAAHQHAACKLIADQVTSRLSLAIREQLLADKQKVTEGTVSAMIEVEPNYTKAQMRVIDAKRVLDECKGALDAFAQRRDMLIQSGANQRKELEGDLVMRGSGDTQVEELKARFSGASS